jgi:hypothetical protein
MGELGKQWKREHLGGCLLGYREVARSETQTLIGPRKMKWKRVVDTRSDTCGGQVLLELFSVLNSNHIEMINGPRP